MRAHASRLLKVPARSAVGFRQQKASIFGSRVEEPLGGGFLGFEEKGEVQPQRFLNLKLNACAAGLAARREALAAQDRALAGSLLARCSYYPERARAVFLVYGRTEDVGIYPAARMDLGIPPKSGEAKPSNRRLHISARIWETCLLSSVLPVPPRASIHCFSAH